MVQGTLSTHIARERNHVAGCVTRVEAAQCRAHSSEKTYQLFLQEISNSPKTIKIEKQDAVQLAKFDISAYQIDEAENIVEDMVHLQKK